MSVRACVRACVRARARVCVCVCVHLLFPAYSTPDPCFTGQHALLSCVSSSDIFDVAKACGVCRFINQTWHLWRRAPSQAVNAAAVNHVCPGPITGVPHSTAQPATDELRQGGRQLQCNFRTPGFHELVHLTTDCVQFTHHWLCTVLYTDCTVHSPLTGITATRSSLAKSNHWSAKSGFFNKRPFKLRDTHKVPYGRLRLPKNYVAKFGITGNSNISRCHLWN